MGEERGGPGSNQYRRKGVSTARERSSSRRSAAVASALGAQARAEADDTAAGISARLDAMVSVTKHGPDYSSNVSVPYSDARRMLAAGRLEEAEHWTLMAEMRFGTITFEQWQAAVAGSSGRLF